MENKIIVWTILLLIATIALSPGREERRTEPKMPPIEGFDPRSEDNYLVLGNALLWTGGEYTKTEIKAIVTGYSSSPEETDDTPFITANGTRVRLGIIACPRNISFGSFAEIDKKIYDCEDRMAKKNEGKFDIWFESKIEALEYGKQLKELTLYKR